jgi:AcrR family transcriptional regulator
VLRAVITILVRDGVDAVTFRSVAREAGVTYGLAHYHFGSRERMVEEALRFCMRQNLARFAETAYRSPLEEFGKDIPPLVAAAPEMAAFQFVMVLGGSRFPGLDRTVREAYETYMSHIRAMLEDAGLDVTDSLVRFVFACLDGIILQQLVFRDADRSVEPIAMLRELLLELRDSQP